MVDLEAIDLEYTKLEEDDISKDQETAIQKLFTDSNSTLSWSSKGEMISALECAIEVPDLESKTPEEVITWFMTEYQDVFALDPDQVEIDVREIETNPQTYVATINQIYKTIEVFHAQFDIKFTYIDNGISLEYDSSTHSDSTMFTTDGNFLYYYDGYIPNLSTSIEYSVSKRQAEKVVVGIVRLADENKNLAIYDLTMNGYELIDGPRIVWEINLTGYTYLVDANTSEIVEKIQYQIYWD
jgi:hypothetical protein